MVSFSETYTRLQEGIFPAFEHNVNQLIELSSVYFTFSMKMEFWVKKMAGKGKFLYIEPFFLKQQEGMLRIGK